MPWGESGKLYVELKNKAEMNLEELKDWNDDARRELEREAEHLIEKEEQIGGYLHVVEATEELLAEIGRLQARLDESQREAERLREQLEAKQEETEALRRKMEAETEAMRREMQDEADALRKQLLDIREQRLGEQQTAIQAQPSRPTEIHNHFESGSSAQVFNSKVNGKFKEKKKWRRIRKGA